MRSRALLGLPPPTPPGDGVGVADTNLPILPLSHRARDRNLFVRGNGSVLALEGGGGRDGGREVFRRVWPVVVVSDLPVVRCAQQVENVWVGNVV